jgi:nucleotide-binding universal stress UspA family protein
LQPVVHQVAPRSACGKVRRATQALSAAFRSSRRRIQPEPLCARHDEIDVTRRHENDAAAEKTHSHREALPPLDALATASAETDLLVVGSRGLHGIRALGSISERIGHLAHSSVLVIREPPRSPATDRDADAVPDSEY